MVNFGQHIQIFLLSGICSMVCVIKGLLTHEVGLSPVPASDAQFLCLQSQSIVGLDNLLELVIVL
jgi:hypothetical protein